MALGEVKFLMDNLSQLFVRCNYADDDIISGVAREELKLLESDVGLLESFLKKAAAANDDHTLSIIRSEISEVIYDVQDAVDALGSWQGGGMDLTQQLRTDKLKQVMDKVVAVDFGGLQIGDDSSVRLRKMHSIMRERSVVGFEDEEEKIFSYLTQPTTELDVITIVGPPGLGKTALAWRMFHDQEIQYGFPIRIWVNQSERSTFKDMLFTILKILTIEDFSSLSDVELCSSIRAHLSEHKFLLVLDDIRTLDDWLAINQFLPWKNKLSKVLIITSERAICVHDRYRSPHHIRFLRRDESWELLRLKVFGTDEKCPPRLQFIGQRIADECRGLPLALLVIGGILYAQLVADERNIDAARNSWINVANTISTFRNGGDEYYLSEIISKVVALSYSELPDDELRNCFLYLGVFPQGYEISAWTLIQLWIAEGFINPTGGEKSLEQAAYDNLEELIARNLVTADKTNYSGQVKTCRVGNAVRDFCRTEASFTEHEMFQEISLTKGLFLKTLECRRLSIHTDPQEFLSRKPKGPRVRSLLCFSEDPVCFLNPKYISTIPDGFKLLRVLDSNKSIKFHQFPKGITKLIHLRYITLSGDSLHVLPEAISQLWNLQTIVIDTMSRRLTVKANIWKMVMLRHLKTEASIILDIKDDKKSDNQNLQTLTRLSPDQCTENVFSKARNLKTLSIFGKLSDLRDAKSLRLLNRLENLKLVHDIFYEHTRIDDLIQPICFPRSLKNLTLSGTFLEWEHMSTVLAKIETLEALKLKDNAFTGSVWDAVGVVGFGNLRFLLIAGMDLVYWNVSDRYFPGLECLVLKNCEKLVEIPVGVAENLRIMEIDRLSKSAVESARNIKKERRQLHLSVGPGCE
ncbi:hypothetical protein CASFOL_022154 [Castilleja foliolosa]|uniref:Uncharacterized protein n=1 Tax=Castilleja foliolosa TaxID=1961234 RepID=A0ABD3CYL9_9LAMI